MEKEDDFEPWRLQWSDTHIDRFWTWRSRDPATQDRYFSRQVGPAILDEVSRHIALKGTVVDLGAGPGYLVEKLLQRRVDTLAVETSAAAVEHLLERHKSSRHFLGALLGSVERVPVPDEAASIVMLIEVIEHLSNDLLARAVRESWRIVKKGGHVVITTPHEEDLGASETMCPSCGCVYHTVQHLRSVSVKGLTELMSAAGFKNVACHATVFSRYRRPGSYVLKAAYRIRRSKYPHLFYVG